LGAQDYKHEEEGACKLRCLYVVNSLTSEVRPLIR